MNSIKNIQILRSALPRVANEFDWRLFKSFHSKCWIVQEMLNGFFFHLMVSESKYIRISFNGHYWNDINMYANLKSKLNFVCRNKPVLVSVIRHLGKYRENSVPFFLNLCSSSTGPNTHGSQWNWNISTHPAFHFWCQRWS